MDTKEITLLLQGAKHNDKQQWDRVVAKRDHWQNTLRDPVFMPVYNYKDIHSQREHALNRLLAISKQKLLSVRDFGTDPHNVFKAHEYCGLIDGSTAIKFTVQFNLFGGTCFALHNGRHDYLFDKIDSFDLIGCFCLTELGFGNNAVKMETTVTYEDDKDEFVVNSPTALSQKYWISNGYNHANYSVVFGQTIVKGKNEGVNAFLVPIRESVAGNALPGVSIRDMGIKFGVNGVDNAVLKFDNVRIPRVNMLNKYCDVDRFGNFKSETKNIGGRFFKVTERLLSGRICIAALCMGGTRGALYLAIKYAQQRKSIGPEGLSTVPIMNYQLQQNALLPLLCRSLALNVFHNYACDVFANPGSQADEMLAICCIDKTMVGWNFERVATRGRERCGGMGFLSISRFHDYLALAHTSLTAEGDNRVLMIKIVKDMITGLTKKTWKLPVPSLNVTQQIGTFNDVTQIDTLLDLLKFREVDLFKKLTKKTMEMQKAGKSGFEVMMHHTSNLVQDLAMAYGERHALESCIAFLKTIQHTESKKVMEVVFRVFGADTIKTNLGYYISENAVSATGAANLITAQNQMIKHVSANVNDLLTCLDVPHDLLYAPLAADYEDYYSRPNFGEAAAARL